MMASTAKVREVHTIDSSSFDEDMDLKVLSQLIPFRLISFSGKGGLCFVWPSPMLETSTRRQ